MNKLSKKRAALLAGVMTVCVLAMPSITSAATWGTVGTEHTLTSTNLQVSTAPVTITWSCASSTLTASVASTANLEITAMTFTNCTGAAQVANCTVTPTANNLPWTATGPSTTDVTVDRVEVRLVLDHKPGAALCAANGLTATITGTQQGGSFGDTGHLIQFTNDTGLVSHLDDATSSIVTTSGTYVDTAAPFLTLT